MNKKSIVISISGVLLLLASVVGATFAFFSYNKIGTKDNVITTGALNFNYAEGENVISINNMFPLSDEEGMNLTGGNSTFNFTVSGYSPESEINYTIIAVPGNTMEGRNRLPDSYVKGYLVGTTTASGVAQTFGPQVFGDVNNGEVLGTGTISGGSSGDPIIHSYTFRMWISDDIVVSDTETSIPDKTVLTNEQYANQYFSVKIKVVAEE